MFPYRLIQGRADVEALEALSARLAFLAKAAWDAAAHAAGRLRPDVIAASLRSMFS